MSMHATLLNRCLKVAITQVFVGGLSVLAGVAGGGLGQVAAQLGTIGAGALLASYSRDNEREADALGMEYMVKAGYDPNGMVGLMDMLRSLNKSKPSAIELMFSTHPMSDERYATAVKRAKEDYAKCRKSPGLPRTLYGQHGATPGSKRSH